MPEIISKKDLALALSANPNVSPKASFKIVSQVKDKGIALSGLRAFCCNLKFSRLAWDCFESTIENKRYLDIAKRCRQEKIKINFCFEDDYPQELLEIFDPPICLFSLGELAVLRRPDRLAIIGSRKATSHGLAVTERIARQAAVAQIVIISGLAVGIDAYAHRGALAGAGKTIAVLGSAIDEVYPAVNKPLAKKILATGGLILSEYPPGFPMAKYNFPLRNRIIAALSKAVLVTEAAQKSGSLITAALALEYGRDVFAVPGDIDKINSVGVNNLIKLGAFCLTSSDDILNYFGIKDHGETSRANLNAQEKEIVNQLRQSPAEFGQIITDGGDSGAISAALTSLELKGLVKQNQLGEYFLTRG